jgi:hypothetical protein
MGEKDPTSPAARWYRRRGLLIALTVFVVLLITVLTDLPVSTSRADDISAERTVMNEVNTDLGPCDLAIHQAVGIWNLQAAHQLTAGERSGTPGLLSDDQAACSLTNESVYDLVNIEVPGTPAGKHIGQLVATVTLWVTSDALRAIEDVQNLMVNPNDSPSLHSLAAQETQLAADRRLAISQESAADATLDVRLPPVNLASPSGGG